jgi:hypothetical protein
MRLEKCTGLRFALPFLPFALRVEPFAAMVALDRLLLRGTRRRNERN